MTIGGFCHEHSKESDSSDTGDEIKAYFLSHAHADHYAGLNKRWSSISNKNFLLISSRLCRWKSGPIYCTNVTARILIRSMHTVVMLSTMLSVKRKHYHTLALKCGIKICSGSLGLILHTSFPSRWIKSIASMAQRLSDVSILLLRQDESDTIYFTFHGIRFCSTILTNFDNPSVDIFIYQNVAPTLKTPTTLLTKLNIGRWEVEDSEDALRLVFDT